MSRAPAELGARAGDNPVDHTVEPTFSPVDKFRVTPGAPTRHANLWVAVDRARTAKCRLSSENTQHSTIHKPYYCYYHLSIHRDRERERTVKFRCERDMLVEALGTAQRAVTNRGASLPVLSGVRLELREGQLLFTGSDLDLTISVTLAVTGSEDGVGVLPAKLVTDIVRALAPGAVEVEVSDEEAAISSGRSQFAVRTIPAHEFPKLPEPANDTVQLDARAFADALRQVVSAASVDESRPILTGVLMTAEEGGLRLVATDSYRLAVRDLPGTSILPEGQSVLVPSHALKELTRLLGDAQSVVLRLGERDA